jgi:hypothetical protein
MARTFSVDGRLKSTEKRSDRTIIQRRKMRVRVGVRVKISQIEVRVQALFLQNYSNPITLTKNFELYFRNLLVFWETSQRYGVMVRRTYNGNSKFRLDSFECGMEKRPIRKSTLNRLKIFLVTSVSSRDRQSTQNLIMNYAAARFTEHVYELQTVSTPVANGTASSNSA